VAEYNNRDILGKSKKIFLTGHTGFKGIWLTLLLEEMGHEVIGYSLDAAANSLYERLGRKGVVQEYFSDIRDVDALNRAIRATNPTIVIHMAAQALVLESYRNPRETFEVNAQGTANLCEASFATESVKVIGAVTTDKVYKNLETTHSYLETDPLEGGSDPYSASKVAAEAVICGWKKIRDVSAGPQIVTLRSGNVIGGGDFSKDRLIPDFVRSNLNGSPVIIRNSQSTRPWMHVLDSLIGYLRAIDNSLQMDKSNVFNFAPVDKSLSVEEIIQIALDTWPGMFTYKNLENSEKIVEAQSLNLDPTKAINELGWSSYWDQQASVSNSVTWWKMIKDKACTVSEACYSEIKKVVN
jgi:CDP-glucose 4,6-dehydratase